MTTREFFDNLAEHWDDDLSPVDEKRRIVAALSGARDAKNILDVACGTGAMFQALEEAGASHVLAIDIAPRMVEMAKEKAKDNPAFTVKVADLFQLEEGGFDLVIIYNAYPHFTNRERLSRKVAELLVTGGRFVIAHGAGKEMINDHHANVPEEVTSTLESVEEEGRFWNPYFKIDMAIDTEEFYFLSGRKSS